MVLNVKGQFVPVQEADSLTISFAYVNGNLPTGLAPGKTVIMRGELTEGLFNVDNITITGGTPCTCTGHTIPTSWADRSDDLFHGISVIVVVLNRTGCHGGMGRDLLKGVFAGSAGRGCMLKNGGERR